MNPATALSRFALSTNQQSKATPFVNLSAKKRQHSIYIRHTKRQRKARTVGACAAGVTLARNLVLTLSFRTCYDDVVTGYQLPASSSHQLAASAERSCLKCGGPIDAQERLNKRYCQASCRAFVWSRAHRQFWVFAIQRRWTKDAFAVSG